MKKSIILLIVLLIVNIIIFSILYFKDSKTEQPLEKIKATMLLIEYKDTIGLGNFVNEMNKRNIPGLLMVTPEFVKANCQEIRQLLKHNIEIVGSNVGAPFWDMPYEEQKAKIINMKEEIEACTGVPLRIISSRYMASDMTTVKIADELGIPYVTARGTTDSKATVYKVEEYNVKILSVSNIPKVQFKYGSLCDYSFFERAGAPNDMMEELMRSIEPLSSKEKARYGSEEKITLVSHTNIGGYLKPWMDMWISFWDNTRNRIEWVGLDELMAEEDWIMPEWQVPINKNAPYTPEKIRPLIPYEEEEKINNPCAVEDIGQTDSAEEETITGNKILVFHNGKGEMCLEALEFFKTINYPIEEHLNTEQDFTDNLNGLRSSFEESEGVSKSFGYYPVIFIKNRAFSGFNDYVKEEILKEI